MVGFVYHCTKFAFSSRLREKGKYTEKKKKKKKKKRVSIEWIRKHLAHITSWSLGSRKHSLTELL